MRHLPIILTVFTALLALSADRSLGEDPALEVRFNRDIQPILSDNCFACHGPDAGERQAGLRLDIREDAVEYGALVEFDPDASSLIERIEADDPDLIMPPPEAHKTLTAQQKRLLRRWVKEGAEYEPHWAYAPIERPAPPEVTESASSDDTPSGEIQPIDAFIYDKLRRARLTPAPPADRPALLRRVYLDLIGLPPSPEEVDAFLNDDSPGAYEAVVDRLLDSPHYGERMAIPWLDVVRYADTVGFHGDQNQNAWAYRDYVIRSFNENKPFDQFTVEQLAGDLLPEPTDEQLTATCFNRLNMMTREGGAQPEEYLAKYAADRVRTVGMAWLGSTFACAECHDHKFDPITAEDFYSLAAFFADIKQWGVYSDYAYTPNPDLKGFNNDYPFPPEITVSSDYLLRRIERLRQQREQLVGTVAERIDGDSEASKQLADWQAEVDTMLGDHRDGWAVAAPVAGDDADELEWKVDDEAAIRFVENAAGTLDIELDAPVGTLSALRLELLPVESEDGKPASILRGGAGGSGSVKVVWQIRRAEAEPKDKNETVAVRHALADSSKPVYRSGFEVIGIESGWTTLAERADRPHVAVWLPRDPLRLSEGDRLILRLEKNGFARVRAAVSPLTPLDINAAHELPLPETETKKRKPSVADPLWVEHFVRAGRAFEAERAELARIDELLLECRGGKTPVLVTERIEPVTVRVLPRGNWQDDSGQVVLPRTPGFLPRDNGDADAADNERRLNRLDLAEWLISDENPLTARVVVNRLWQQFFGAGLSRHADDFGAQGEAPSHPELLDYLASELRENGWDIKRIVREIVTSDAYRHDSRPVTGVSSRDPDNRLLAYHPPRRLEAEIVRDNALRIAAALNLDHGGPPIKPYQPDGHYANLQFPNRSYIAETDDRQYRRGVYMHWQRTFLHPMLLNFGAPTREDCIAVRTAANTPQQALTLLNDPAFVEAAKLFAVHLLAQTENAGDGQSSDASTIDYAYRRAVARPPKDDQRESMLELLAQLREAYGDKPDDARRLITAGLQPPPSGIDAVELAAWTNVCRVILNLHETITRY